jgi:hypothetical protein
LSLKILFVILNGFWISSEDFGFKLAPNGASDIAVVVFSATTYFFLGSFSGHIIEYA